MIKIMFVFLFVISFMQASDSFAGAVQDNCVPLPRDKSLSDYECIADNDAHVPGKPYLLNDGKEVCCSYSDPVLK